MQDGAVRLTRIEEEEKRWLERIPRLKGGTKVAIMTLAVEVCESFESYLVVRDRCRYMIRDCKGTEANAVSSRTVQNALKGFVLQN